MEKEKLQKVLELHKLYLVGDSNGIRADLSYANLRSTDLRSTDLSYANLRSANLRSTNLRSANLSYANLRSANLSYADLRSANLSYANLRSTDLRYADLSSAKNLPGLLISQYQKDLLYVLMHCKSEVPFLKEKLLAGEIDGTQYEGECACLIGTLANADGGLAKLCSVIPYYEKGLHNMSEQLFFQIKKGDKPETNQFSKIALETIEYFENNY